MGAIRFSLGRATTEDEIDAVVDALMARMDVDASPSAG